MNPIPADDSKTHYILVAPNGARRTKADHPALPVTIDQIVETARACHLAGAQGIHVHVRDANGQHSLDAGSYLETIAELRRIAPRLDVQITTEAAGVFDVPAQLACLEQVRPDWASISVREIARDPNLAPRVYALCADQGTRVQHILYDEEDARLLDQWQQDDIVRKDQTDRLFVLGRYSEGQQSVPADLDAFPKCQNYWMVCAFGAQEHACLAEAARRGGDVRVGFENSLTGPDGTPWADNAASVAALVELLGKART
ncbi:MULTISPECIES: 3-keto-5-aminohexanoate cleavage protein [unclassified Ruegeria]|uniref:3-keto-5-aminohexanoate cleavage protein n=1 Tax=unclassified Ruegeria TaxID=2625375 RepID=UPI001489FDDA|nr:MULTISPECIES: 3-keto-5-aminohexanoate cleavage protein [unclassified Ruegeria]NOD33624.1 3-keto-5-aminohexanoate cleavage protein [Ruegeria sp. HKCCD7296]NOE40701.1 3-keto-5-aminohexanoate cleavage protein [Ruegeria sp. HKCCD7319]